MLLLAVRISISLGQNNNCLKIRKEYKLFETFDNFYYQRNRLNNNDRDTTKHFSLRSLLMITNIIH